MAKSTKKIRQMVKIPENSYPLYKSIFNDTRISSDAKIIITKAIGLMNVSLNRGHTRNHFKDFYNYTYGFWYVKYPIDKIISETGMSPYKASKGIAELYKYDYIGKKRDFRGFIWRLPKYERFYSDQDLSHRPRADNQCSQETKYNAPNRSKDTRNKDIEHTNTFEKQVFKWKHTTAINLNINSEDLNPIVNFIKAHRPHKPLPLLHKLYYVCFIEPRNYYINPKTHYVSPNFNVNKSLAILENNPKFRKGIGLRLGELFAQIKLNTDYNNKHPNKEPRTPNANDNSYIAYLVGMIRFSFEDWLDAKPKKLSQVDSDSDDIEDQPTYESPKRSDNPYELQVPNITSDDMNQKSKVNPF